MARAMETRCCSPPESWAGKLFQAVGEPHLGQGLCRVERARTDLARELDVLECGEVGDEVVELKDEAHVGAPVLNELGLAGMRDVAPIDPDGAGSEGVHAAEDVERGGLARARCAEDDGELAASTSKLAPSRAWMRASPDP